jgi:energy-coupling factor transporter ATP-binding protein EcfA2
VPMVSKAQVMALTAGDGWLEKGANLLLFGPPGAGKSHLAAAIGLALVENGWRVLFIRTSDLVQRLQIARRELALESAVAKLDKYHLLILDDIVYVSKDQAETSVLFELIGSRYERRSMLITANQPFGDWGKVFPDQAMTLAAIDRLVHHATIFEMMSRAIDAAQHSIASVAQDDRQRARQSSKTLIDAQRQSKKRRQEKRLPNSRLKMIMPSLPAAASNSDCRRRSHPDCRAIGREAGRPRPTWFRTATATVPDPHPGR